MPSIDHHPVRMEGKDDNNGTYTPLEGSSMHSRKKLGLVSLAVVGLVALSCFAGYSLAPSGSPQAAEPIAYSADELEAAADLFRQAYKIHAPDAPDNENLVQPKGTTQDINIGNRKFELYQAEGMHPGPETCLVVAWHGVTANPYDAEDKMQLKSAIDGVQATCPGGWLLAYPYGTTLITSFNGAGCCPTSSTSNVDDIQFGKDIISYFEDLGQVNPHNVFATGFSNGGFMTHRLGCQSGYRDDGHPWWKAIAPHSGLIGKDSRSMSECSADNDVPPMPIMSFHATDDPTVGWDGTVVIVNNVHSFEETRDLWAGLNECTGDPVEVDHGAETTVCMKYENCKASHTHPSGVTVEFCSVYPDHSHTYPQNGGLGHQWSGRLTASPRDQDIDATSSMLHFFSQYIE